MNLTKDADLLACCLYKEFLNRRKSGIPKRQANYFDSTFYKSSDKISSWCSEDFHDTVVELKHEGLAKMYIDGGFAITDAFVIYMENRFRNNLIEVTDFIAKFIP